MRAILSAWVAVTLLAVAAAPADAQAAASGGTVERVPGTLRGTITDAAGAGLAAVTVKIFEEGFLIAEGETGADGSYSVEFEYAPELDWTMVAWFVPPSGDLICEIVVLRESLRSKELELLNACLPRVELRSTMKYDSTLHTEEGKLAQMSSLDCLGDDTQ